MRTTKKQKPHAHRHARTGTKPKPSKKDDEKHLPDTQQAHPERQNGWHSCVAFREHMERLAEGVHDVDVPAVRDDAEGHETQVEVGFVSPEAGTTVVDQRRDADGKGVRISKRESPLQRVNTSARRKCLTPTVSVS